MRRTALFVLALTIAPIAPLAAHDWNGLAIDARGNLYVVDAEDGQIWKITPAGTVSVFVKGTPRGQTCHHPHHLAMDPEGLLWFASG